MNKVFYVSDMDMSNGNHFRKMETEKSIASHIASGMKNCDIERFSDYNGEMINADSVGIVIPAHRWGISLALVSFIKNLKISAKTYVYAIVFGEDVRGDITKNGNSVLKSIEQIKKAFAEKIEKICPDIFVKSSDRIRSVAFTEYKMRNQESLPKMLECILNGLLFHRFDELKTMDSVSNKDALVANHFIKPEKSKSNVINISDTVYQAARMSNIFLDDELFAGVKLCQVI